MAIFDHAFVPRDAAITLSDLASALTFTVPYEEGDFSMEEIGANYSEVFYPMARGVQMVPRYTQTQRVAFSFSAIATDFTDATEKTLRDAVMKQNAWSGAVSTMGASAQVYSLRLKWLASLTAYGAAANPSLTLEKGIFRIAFSEGIPGKFAIKGEAALLNTSTDITWT